MIGRTLQAARLRMCVAYEGFSGPFWKTKHYVSYIAIFSQKIALISHTFSYLNFGLQTHIAQFFISRGVERKRHFTMFLFQGGRSSVAVLRPPPSFLVSFV